MILLDTHCALWLLNDEPALGASSLTTMMEARIANELAISSISFWKIALFIAKGRLDLRISAAELRRQLLDTGVIELPLTGDIATLAAELKNIHCDPADRFIAATAIVHGATLMTADKRLLNWRHSLKRQNATK